MTVMGEEDRKTERPLGQALLSSLHRACPKVGGAPHRKMVKSAESPGQ